MAPLAARRSLRQLPATRAECLPGGANELRPCPYLTCRHHLAIDLKTYANGKTAIAHIAEGWDGIGEISEDRPSCALDIASAGDQLGTTEIAAMTGTPSGAQHVHYIARTALGKLPEPVVRYLATLLQK